MKKFSLHILYYFTLLGVVGCSHPKQSNCSKITRDEAIKLTNSDRQKVLSRSSGSLHDAMLSEHIEKIELNLTQDRSSAVAVVKFKPNNSTQAVALIFSDCEINWTLR